jgi:hypothetical protein
MPLQQLEHWPLIFSRCGGQWRPYIRHGKPHVEYCLRHGRGHLRRDSALKKGRTKAKWLYLGFVHGHESKGMDKWQ